MQRAAELDQPAIALTDRDGLYGAVRFMQACMNNGMSGILGVDLAQHPTVSDRPEAVHRTCPRRRLARPPRPSRRAAGARWPRMGCCEPFGVLSPHVRAAGQSRCRLGSARGVRRTGDLSVLLGPDSEVGRAISRHRFDLADTLLRRWREVAGVRCTWRSSTTAQLLARSANSDPVRICPPPWPSGCGSTPGSAGSRRY